MHELDKERMFIPMYITDRKYENLPVSDSHKCSEKSGRVHLSQSVTLRFFLLCVLMQIFFLRSHPAPDVPF